ncbi:hypothetical protein Tco_0608076 [Tanacetum coccineum]
MLVKDLAARYNLEEEVKQREREREKKEREEAERESERKEGKKRKRERFKQEGREENIRKRSGRRLKMKATKKSKRQKTDSVLEEEEQLRASLKIVPEEEEEIDYEVLGMSAPCYTNEALAIPEQTATGKEISNQFMAGEDCWVIEDFTTYCCWFNIGVASEDLVLDPSPYGRILLLISLLNSFHREGLQNSATTSLCSNNIKESLSLKHRLVSRTYSKKSLFMDLALYDNESWNDPRNFAKPVKAISLPQNVPSTSNRRLIELENQVQCLIEAHLAPKQPIQVKKITSLCEICSGPHDTQYCMENPKQAFINYASSHIDEAGGKWYTFKPEQNNLGDTYNPSWKSNPNLSSINAITICPKQPNKPHDDKSQTVTEIRTRQTKEPEQTLEDEFRDLHLNLPVLDVLAHALMYNAILDKYMESLELGTNGSAFIKGEMPKRMEDPELFTIPCRLEDSKPFDTLADLGSCVNIILLYLFKKLNIGLLEETNHVFGLADGTKSYLVGILEIPKAVISSTREALFVEISNMTHDPHEGIVKFTNGTDEISYKMPHKIEQYNSLSDLNKEHTKSVYLRNEEDKRIGVEYVMSKILGFYKECLELGPKYLTGIADEG